MRNDIPCSPRYLALIQRVHAWDMCKKPSTITYATQSIGWQQHSAKGQSLWDFCLLLIPVGISCATSQLMQQK